eukprot:scpid109483/ scgid15332/ 
MPSPVESSKANDKYQTLGLLCRAGFKHLPSSQAESRTARIPLLIESSVCCKYFMERQEACHDAPIIALSALYYSSLVWTSELTTGMLLPCSFTQHTHTYTH